MVILDPDGEVFLGIVVNKQFCKGKQHSAIQSHTMDKVVNLTSFFEYGVVFSSLMCACI